MLPLHDARAVRAIEVLAAGDGDEDALMQRAGLACWRTLLRRWPEVQRIVICCGPGNNGGDGYVLALYALRGGRDVAVVRLAAHAPATGTARRACAAFEAAGGRVRLFVDDGGPQGTAATGTPGASGVGGIDTDRDADTGTGNATGTSAGLESLQRAGLVVDAVFGIGLSRAPDAATARLLRALAGADAPVMAIDVPSGVDADRGDVPGEAVTATLTLQLLARHVGLQTGAALEHVGELAYDALDAPPATLSPASPVVAARVAPHVAASVAPSAWLLRAPALAAALPPRPRNSHKGHGGHVLCIGGDHGHGGAVLLAVDAALHAGAGLVTAATRSAHVAPLLARRPEAMARGIEDGPDDDVLARLLAAATVVAVGPGLGQGGWGRALFAAALAAARPLVLDADALQLLAHGPRPLAADTVLTPHPGEAGRLLGIAAADVQRDRPGSVRALADRHGCVVVLKGAGTLVAAPGRTPRVIDAGNPGMAVGGMGDLLTGTIAALRAQGLDAFDAACHGALLHALAGDAAAADGGERGLLPSDLLPWLRRGANPGGRA